MSRRLPPAENRILALLLCFAVCSCGESDAPADTESGADVNTDVWVGEDLFDNPDTTASQQEEPTDFGMEIEVVQSQIPSSGQMLTTWKYVPEGCSTATPCPGVVLVPDLIMGGEEFFEIERVFVLPDGWLVQAGSRARGSG